MRWLFVKKHRVKFCVLFILFVSIAQSLYTLSHATAPKTKAKGQLQIGFYDLLANQQEKYTVQIIDMNGAKLVTITQPDDNLFLIRGRLDEMEERNNRTYYNYSPVRYNNPENYKMIFSFIDFLRHNDVWVYPMIVNKQPLAIGQSGMMFIYSFKN